MAKALRAEWERRLCALERRQARCVANARALASAQQPQSIGQVLRTLIDAATAGDRLIDALASLGASPDPEAIASARRDHSPYQGARGR